MNDIKHSFSPKILISLTFLACAIALLLSGDDDTAILVYCLAGFVYALLLRISLRKNLSVFRTGVAFLILGGAAMVIFVATAPLGLLPFSVIENSSGRYLAYLFPSLVGSIITLITLKHIWKIDIYKSHWVSVGTSMFIVPLITIVLLSLFEQTAYGKWLSVSLNSIVWWLAFSLGLVAAQSHANKFKNENVSEADTDVASTRRPF